MKAITSPPIPFDCSFHGVTKPESYRAAFRDQLNRLQTVGPILAAYAELDYASAADPAAHAHVMLAVPGGSIDADADDRSVGMALSHVMEQLANDLWFYAHPAIVGSSHDAPAMNDLSRISFEI